MSNRPKYSAERDGTEWDEKMGLQESRRLDTGGRQGLSVIEPNKV